MVRAPAKLLSSQKVESVILTIHSKHWIKKKNVICIIVDCVQDNFGPNHQHITIKCFAGVSVRITFQNMLKTAFTVPFHIIRDFASFLAHQR